MCGEGCGAAGPALDGVPEWGDGDDGVWGAISVKGAQSSTRVGSQRCSEGSGGHSPTAQPWAHGASSIPSPGACGQHCLVATGPAGAARAGLQEKELERDLCAAPLYY